MRRQPHKLRRIINKEPRIPATMVFAVVAQSNLDGWSSDPTNSTALTNGYAYECYPNGSTCEFFPLSRTRLGRTQGGPQPAFCQTWAAAAGGVVLWVDCAIGGSAIVKTAKGSLTGTGPADYSGGTWDLTDAANHYDNWARTYMRAALNAARRYGFDVRKRVVVSAIGETDAGANALSSGPAFRTNYVALVDKIATDFDIDAWLMSELGTNGVSLGSSNSFWNAIRSAQTDIVSDRPTLCTMAFNDAKNFFDAGKMVDTLHYTQTGYNEMGAAMATAGLSFLGGVSMPRPPTSKFTAMAKAFPPVAGWKRVLIDSLRVGSINPQFYSDPTTPFAVTWMDSTGTNAMDTTQSVSWTLPAGGPRQVCLYVHDSIGSSGAFVAGANLNATRIRFPDGVVKFNSFNLGDSGARTSQFQMTLQDVLSLDAATLRTLSFTTAPFMTITDEVLSRYSGLTGFNITSSPTGALNLALVPNLVTFTHSACGLTTAQINAYLVALDAAGLSNGTCFITQSGAAPPSGAGATAKTALQGKGWTVTTD